jgi:secreted protein with Ig-like and vWFA domain
MAGWSAIGLAGASLGSGAWTTVSARGVRSGDTSGLTHAEAASRNQRIQTLNRRSTALYAAGAVAGAVGLGLLLWPESGAEAFPMVAPGSAGLNVEGRF